MRAPVSGNAVYKEADLSELTVTVTHSDDLDKGDVVTAQIPASLIPMRNYNVDADAKTLTVSDAYPIRLFYNVSVKADAKSAIGQGVRRDVRCYPRLSNVPKMVRPSTSTPTRM